MKLHVLLLFVGILSASGAELSEDVAAFCQEFFDWRVKSLPQFATFVGIPDFNNEMDDVSEEGYDKRYEEAKQYLVRAKEVREAATEHIDILNMDVLVDGIESFLSGYDYRMNYLTISNIEGPHTDYLNILEWMPKDDLSAYQNITSRMNEMAKQLDDMIALLKQGVNVGMTLHEISLSALNDSLGKFVVENPEDSPMYKFFKDSFPSSMSEDETTEIQNTIQTIISEQISPAFERLRKYLTEEYQPRPDIAISSLTNGPDLYQELIKFHTSTNMTAEEIQEIGYSEVKTIQGKMMEIVQELGHDGMTVQEFSNMIREDPSNFYNTSEELMDAFNEIVHDLIPLRLPKLFKNIPKAELKVVANPSENSPGAFYLTGSYDGSRPGVFYVNSLKPKAQPIYDMITLSLHEGNPGHHFQGSHAIESKVMPYFRRVVDDRNYNIAPSKFATYTSYLEGWALYTESLGFELGLYEDLLDRYGHYSEEIFRACRLVVDTGIHALGWTREQAIDYMFENTASTRHEIENEIDRYITWPGQALAYKIGELKFTELRKRAEDKLGDQFDIKDFHQVVLDSFGPMYIVEQEVDYWIKSKL